MPPNNLPWIEVLHANEAPWLRAATQPAASGSSSYAWRALFACQVCLLPFDELTARKWGFNNGALLEEAFDRRRLFVESQHTAAEPQSGPADCRALSLRCRNDPTQDGLLLSLIARVCASSSQAARQAACEYWLEIASTFPWDYQLLPASSQAEYHRLCGENMWQGVDQVNSLAEVQRFEAVVSLGSSLAAGENPYHFLLMGQWGASRYSNEQTWRLLAGADREVMLDVQVHPSVLYEEEKDLLDSMGKSLEKASKSASSPQVLPYVQYAARKYAENLALWMYHPYHVQVHLVAPQGLPDYLPRALGFALTHTEDSHPPAPGFQIVRPQDSENAAHWRDCLQVLEPALTPIQDARFTRMRYLTGAIEACSLLQLPYPPGPGLPGVHFAGC